MSNKSKQFFDRLRIFVKSGSGSAGNPKIRGKGGDGGSIYVCATENRSLLDISTENPKKRWIANSGRRPSSRRGICLGINAQNINISVPVGISVSLGDSKGGNKILGDLNCIGQKILVAHGGTGGLPVTNYLGGPGEAHHVVLDLKLMADVGLIGLPNAGKSSLLQAVSGAKAKIAAYPFTTLRPQLASITYPDHRIITMTDLPGLADIAAKFEITEQTSYASEENGGPPLVHTAFLKHLERTSCILVVLDALGFQANQFSPHRTPLASAMLLVSQLQRYAQGRLLNKPLLCVINKIDLPYAREQAEETREALLDIDSPRVRQVCGLSPILLPRHSFQFEDVFLISAKKRENLEELKDGLRHWLDVFELRRRQADLEETEQTSRACINSALKEKLPKIY